MPPAEGPQKLSFVPQMLRRDLALISGRNYGLWTPPGLFVSHDKLTSIQRHGSPDILRLSASR